MAKLRLDTIENREGTSSINVDDIQITYDALINKGQYRPQIRLGKYQDSFVYEGEIYIGKRKELPYILTGTWDIDKEYVRVYATIDHSASSARDFAEESEQHSISSGEFTIEAKEFSEASEQYSIQAERWANEDVGVEIEEGKYSAKHYASEAETLSGTGDFARKSKNLSDMNPLNVRQNLGIKSGGSAEVLNALGDSEYDVVSQKTLTEALETKSDKSITISTRSGIGGGGTLGEDIEIFLLPETVESLGKADNSVQIEAGKSLYPDTDSSKLGGIANEATKNESDEYLLNRENHTGEQAISSIAGLTDELEKIESISTLVTILTDASEEDLTTIKDLLGIV